MKPSGAGLIKYHYCQTDFVLRIIIEPFAQINLQINFAQLRVFSAELHCRLFYLFHEKVIDRMKMQIRRKTI